MGWEPLNDSSDVPKVAVLVDCDNSTPEMLDCAMNVALAAGKPVVRRGYGNPSSLSGKWQEKLVEAAFSPCLQFSYASGKNTADIALALDAMEDLLTGRSEVFCLVTSDSDFAYLCRKLREHGARIHLIGDERSPKALRNAADHFHLHGGPAKTVRTSPKNAAGVPDSAPNPKGPTKPAVAIKALPKVDPSSHKTSAAVKKTVAALNAAADPKTVPPSPRPKRYPRTLPGTVKTLGAATPGRWVPLTRVGSQLRAADASFSPKVYGHANLLRMLQGYPELELRGSGSCLAVRIKEDAEQAA
ncbi:MAG: NYN domain-containing protein [Propionibacteriaceae bacterium]|nr:NYN domain-containing protein [Propionibacteriaceae bacterium]